MAKVLQPSKEKILERAKELKALEDVQRKDDAMAYAEQWQWAEKLALVCNVGEIEQPLTNWFGAFTKCPLCLGKIKKKGYNIGDVDINHYRCINPLCNYEYATEHVTF